MNKRFLLLPVLALLMLSCSATRKTADASSPESSLLTFIDTTFAGLRSIRSYGVLPDNTPEANRDNLQRAIDEASRSGAALFVEPVCGGYPVATGLVLKKNVSLIGVHGPTGRGTVADGHPTGSLFVITDTIHPFITVESASQLRGIQFWYPEQTWNDPSRVIPYKPTIRQSADSNVQGVTLSCLTFYGEFMAMDFRSPEGRICEQILFEHCYGYPLSGEFIAIDRCYDIPRILHCHVNPANMREFGRSFSRSVIDSVVARKTFTYWVDHTDNAQFIDLFTFGTYGGIRLGADTYGQLTNFNLDCVSIGIWKSGSNAFNRNWQIAQGSIIANCGERVEDIHPIVIDGMGHTALTNVECFSGNNGAITNLASSYDFLTVRGNKHLTVTAFGCRMRNYVSDDPLHIENPNALVRFVGCIDKNEQLFER